MWTITNSSLLRIDFSRQRLLGRSQVRQVFFHLPNALKVQTGSPNISKIPKCLYGGGKAENVPIFSVVLCESGLGTRQKLKQL